MVTAEGFRQWRDFISDMCCSGRSLWVIQNSDFTRKAIKIFHQGPELISESLYLTTKLSFAIMTIELS